MLGELKPKGPKGPNCALAEIGRALTSRAVSRERALCESCGSHGTASNLRHFIHVRGLHIGPTLAALSPSGGPIQDPVLTVQGGLM